MKETTILLKDRIRTHYASLTEGQKRVAEYVLKNPNVSAVESAAEIGKQAGVSETTVIRFCYSLGYEGFTEVQKELQRQLLLSKSSLDTFVKSKRLIAADPHFYAKVMEKDRENIAIQMRNMDEKQFDDAIHYLERASNVLIAGLHASYPAALWFGFTLNLFRGKTKIYRPDTDNIFLLSREIDPSWTVLVISFHRYAKETIELARTAKELGANVIAITDSLLAPVATYANNVLPLEIERKSTIDIAAPLFSVLNSLLAGYSLKNLGKVEQRMKAYDMEVEMIPFYKPKDDLGDN
jgi:DNA-binding MurR/RpiR family transcriptional regulator